LEPGSFAVTGGGGKAVFNKGLPSFEAPISMLPLLVSSNGIPTTAYSVNGYMEGSQFIFGLQLNGSYIITDDLSGALGFRMNMVSNAYTGHLTDIRLIPNIRLLILPPQ
jgi:long-chain fatty acid transport protein